MSEIVGFPSPPKGLPEPLARSDYGYSEWRSITEASYQWRDVTGTLIEDRPVPSEVVEIWWTSNGDDEDIGTELSLYGVMRFADGRWGYLEAWNDYTGWGCQDGVDWTVSDTAAALVPMMTDEGRSHLKWRGEE